MYCAHVKSPDICYVSRPAVGEEDPLQWPKTQRKCKRLLPEVDGGAGSESY